MPLSDVATIAYQLDTQSSGVPHPEHLTGLPKQCMGFWHFRSLWITIHSVSDDVVHNLDLSNLGVLSPMSNGMLEAYAEAATVMLWKFHDVPPPPTSGTWTNQDEKWRVTLQWTQPFENIRRSHGNEKDATEYGAYAVAIAVAAQLGFRVIGRAYQGSGSDFVMVPKGEPANDYYTLEVSGMARINNEKPESRLKKKVEQGSNGDLRRPGFAIVTRFQDVTILSQAWE